MRIFFVLGFILASMSSFAAAEELSFDCKSPGGSNQLNISSLELRKPSHGTDATMTITFEDGTSSEHPAVYAPDDEAHTFVASKENGNLCVYVNRDDISYFALAIQPTEQNGPVTAHPFATLRCTKN